LQTAITQDENHQTCCFNVIMDDAKQYANSTRKSLATRSMSTKFCPY